MNGYIETQEHIDWRMNRSRLRDIEATYGANWEQVADAIHPLIAAAEAEVNFADAFSDPRTEAEKAADADWQDEQATRADLLAGM